MMLLQSRVQTAGRIERPVAVTVARRRLHSAAAAVVGGLAAAALVLIWPGSGPSPEDVQAYAEAVHSTALAAGTIIELEMKPGITDIRQAAFPPDVLAGFAERWSSDLRRLRTDLTLVPVPRGLRSAHDGFLASLAGYAEVAETLRAAPLASSEEQERLIARAIAAGDATDQVWNAARDELEALLGALGLDSRL